MFRFRKLLWKNYHNLFKLRPFTFGGHTYFFHHREHSGSIWPCSLLIAYNSTTFDLQKFRGIGEGILPWATPCLGPSRFFLNEKKINIFRLMHIALFLKVTYKIQIFLKNISWKFIFHTVFLGKLIFRWAK